MTCVVGIAHDGIVTLAADKLVSSASVIEPSRLCKIFTSANMLFGIAGYIRCLNIVQYQCRFEPKPDSVDAMWYVVNHVVETIRSAMKDGGVISTEDGVEQVNFECLIGLNGKLYEIATNFSVIEHEKYAAVGNGSAFAYGAIYAYIHSGQSDWRQCLRQAMGAAAQFSPAVGFEIDMESL